jgi:hypothetical protein
MNRLILWLYDRLLRLHPARFYDEFAEEMRGIFAQELAFRRESGSVLPFLVRELVGIGESIMREQWAHYQYLRQHSPEAAKFLAANTIMRVFSVVYALFFIWLSIIFIQRGDYWNGLVTLVFETILLVGVIIGWRWMLTGGIITLTSAITLTVIVMAAIFAILGNVVISLIAALTWTIPGFLFGIFLLKLAHHKSRLKRGLI